MPLTIAHPAAVIPFRKSGFSLSALMIGSLAPDFEYFLHLSPRTDFSHTAPGLFAFCIPVGLVALWVFHAIWKRPLMAMAGAEHIQHYKPFHFWPLSRLLIVCGGILIGSLLHVMWDSFTHDYGWLVQHVEELRQGVRLGTFEPPLYLLLNTISTVAGLGKLAFVAFNHRQWTWRAVTLHWPIMVIASLILISVITFFILIWHLHHRRPGSVL